MTATAPPYDPPLVTFALFAYNQETYIREAVEGAFSQTYEPLEIILSDDCSSDRTFEIMQEMAAAYEGPHAVRVRQNRTNSGLAVHFNSVIEVSHGGIIVIAAGDDVSLPSRTKESVTLLQHHPNATAVLFSADVIDQTGVKIGERFAGNSRVGEKVQTLQDLLNFSQATFGATRAMRRAVFVDFGPLLAECPSEDTPLLLRSLMCGSNILSSHKLVLYRKHSGNLSGAASLARMNIRAIYSQYRSDIVAARNACFIGANMEQKLNDWLVDDQKVRDVKQKAIFGERLTFRDLIFAMRHPAFSMRNKAKIALTSLASKRSKSR